jgi:hypothetical protein
MYITYPISIFFIINNAIKEYNRIQWNRILEKLFAIDKQNKKQKTKNKKQKTIIYLARY